MSGGPPAPLRRVVVVGGPRTGKSTLARDLRAQGYPVFCTDPRSAVRVPDPYVTYMPEHVGWADAGRYAAEQWLVRPGPWVVEGVAAVRALRRRLDLTDDVADEVVVLTAPYGDLTAGQRALHSGVATVWAQIADRLAHLVAPCDATPPDRSQLQAVDELVARLEGLLRR